MKSFLGHVALSRAVNENSNARLWGACRRKHGAPEWNLPLEAQGGHDLLALIERFFGRGVYETETGFV